MHRHESDITLGYAGERKQLQPLFHQAAIEPAGEGINGGRTLRGREPLPAGTIDPIEQVHHGPPGRRHQAPGLFTHCRFRAPSFLGGSSHSRVAASSMVRSPTLSIAVHITVTKEVTSSDVMGHILHDWNLEDKKMLIAKAYAALPRPAGV